MRREVHRAADQGVGPVRVLRPYLVDVTLTRGQQAFLIVHRRHRNRSPCPIDDGPSASSRNVRPVVALAAVPLVRYSSCFGLLPERLGMQLPGVLRSYPSRLSTVTVPKALLELGRFLVQGRGAAVGCKLRRPRSRSAVSYSHHPVRFVHRRPPHSGVAVQPEAAART
jgi:hypothetical protein